jgi:EAL domain-containing protein (putative c-di-GMP-specific phosphodiesterase class I)
VETIDELDWLVKNTSIRYAQGYYFSKAISLSQLQDGRFDRADRPRMVGRHSAPLRLLQVR